MKYFLLVLFVVFFIYRGWFDLGKSLSSGDWPYLFLENIQAFKIPIERPFLWLEPYYEITAKLGVEIFSFSWEITEKIFWFWPFLIISLVSSYFFLKYLATRLEIERNASIFISLGSLIFTTNTYILMITGGGQMGIAIAYSLAPLVLFANIKYQMSNIKYVLGSGLVFGVQMIFDPRIFLLTAVIAIAYAFFISKEFKRTFFSLIVAILVNLFWIIPNFFFYSKGYADAVSATSASFLSFATFSNSLSLLHPNWPENLFGKIGFMKSEFIMLPIIAYSSLFFIKNSKLQLKSQKLENNSTIEQSSNRAILFFVFLGLTGAFLAKGTNPPFGEIYVWLSNLPGFGLFRDSTKFYLWVVLAFSVLIPFSLFKLSEKVSSIRYKVLSIGFLLFWLILIHPAVFVQLTGTFRPHEVPKEYIILKDFLNTQPEFFKTLWVPAIERFGFNSRTKPAISSVEIFGVSSVSRVLERFEFPEVKNQLKDEEVKYIIIPYDILQEIFITDRKYDNRLYMKTIDKLENIHWLSEVKNNNFGRIKVFEISKF